MEVNIETVEQRLSRLEAQNAFLRGYIAGVILNHGSCSRITPEIKEIIGWPIEDASPDTTTKEKE